MGVKVEVAHSVRGLRYGVVAAAAPRVATKDAAHREPQTLKRAVLLQSLEGVLRTSGGKPTRGGREGGHALTIETNGNDQ